MTFSKKQRQKILQASKDCIKRATLSINKYNRVIANAKFIIIK